MAEPLDPVILKAFLDDLAKLCVQHGIAVATRFDRPALVRLEEEINNINHQRGHSAPGLPVTSTRPRVTPATVGYLWRAGPGGDVWIELSERDEVTSIKPSSWG
jgi:hypothetical protein